MSLKTKLDRGLLPTLLAKESSCENTKVHEIGVHRGEHLAKPCAVRKNLDVLLHPRQVIAEIVQNLRESIEAIENLM